MRIFLSYSSRFAADARALAAGLRRSGVNVWCDALGDIPPGEPFVAALEAAIANCTHYVVLVTDDLESRFWTQQEFHYALRLAKLERGPRIVPLVAARSDVEKLGLLGNFEAVEVSLARVRDGDQGYLRELGARIENSSTDTSQLAATHFVPYPGLAAIEDPKQYFGRDEDLFDAMELVETRLGSAVRHLLVEGNSGVGKSSFVHAGLVPRLRAEWTAAQAREWVTVVVRPGADPTASLAAAIAHAPDLASVAGANMPPFLTIVDLVKNVGLPTLLAALLPANVGFMLVLDQLEELATAPDETSVSIFARNVQAMLAQDAPRFVVGTVRSDLARRARDLLALADPLVGTDSYVLRGMTHAGLRDAIKRPASLAGLTIDDTFVELIVSDAERVGARKEDGEDRLPDEVLPLLGQLLRGLYERRAGTRLTLSAYRELGGLAGALTSEADRARVGIPEDALGRMFLALVNLSRQHRETRRAATAWELREHYDGDEPGDEATFKRVLERLVTGEARGTNQRYPRLLVQRTEPGPDGSAGTTYALVHDSLLLQWPWLRARISLARQLLICRDDLERAHSEWVASGEDPAWLPSGARLRYLETADIKTSATRRMLDQAREREERTYRWLPWVASTIGVATLCSVAAWGWAHYVAGERIQFLEEQLSLATDRCPHVAVFENEGDVLCVGGVSEAVARARLCILRYDRECREQTAIDPAQCGPRVVYGCAVDAFYGQDPPSMDEAMATDQFQDLQGCLDQCASLYGTRSQERDECVIECLPPPEPRLSCHRSAVGGARSVSGWWVAPLILAWARARRRRGRT